MTREAAEHSNALRWLATKAGSDLLSETALLPEDRLTRITRLRKHASIEIAAAAVELLELRRKARAKFADTERMFFTAEGLEQATGDAIAAYRASRFPADIPVLDACSGIGADARRLAARHRVIAVDRDPAAAFCTSFNATLPYAFADAPANPSHTICADVTTIPLARLRDAGVMAAFFDPSRRTDHKHGGRRRLRAAEDYSPPLSWLEKLRAYFPMVAVKVSPAIDDEALRHNNVRVEFLSDRGECKESVLWFGPIGENLIVPKDASPDTQYFATVLRKENPPATLSPFACPPLPLSEPRTWLYEPDPAVIRAHLVPQVAALLDAAALEPQIAYITSDREITTPFATRYRILDALPFDIKQIQARLRALGAHISAVKKRGVPFEPAEVQKKLTPAGARSVILILTRKSGKVFALLCERMASANDL